VEGFTTIGTLDLKKSEVIITQDLHHTTEPPGHKLLVVNVIVVGPFEEKEEGSGVSSDVLKVQGIPQKC